MIIRPPDPDSYIAVVNRHTCAFHKAHPGIHDYPGCSCSTSYSTRPATPEERQENRRQREERERDRAAALAEFGWPPW